MARLLTVLAFILTIRYAHFSEPDTCTIELECDECVPENMPVLTSHEAGGGTVTLRAGDELRLACPGGKFLQYPLRDALRAHCEAGRFRVHHDRRLLHLLELGCQAAVFEDVLHEVAECAPPLQGRVYRAREPAGAVRHLATLCYDEDAGVARRLHACNAPRSALPLPPHAERAAPLSLLGSFDSMFDARTRRDAELLYADDARMTRRLRELVRPARFSLAEQTLTAAPLLSPLYFEAASAGATRLVSNRAAVWRGVAAGNLRLAQRDAAAWLAAARGARLAHVYAGVHGALELSAGEALALRAGGRFPVARYVWTALHVPAERRGLALVVLNDPLVAVSEIRAAVFCESACGAVPWLTELRRNRHFERPAAGLVFCCSLRDLAAVVPSLPRVFNETTELLVS